MSRSSPRTGSRRQVVLIVPLFAVLALSGCLGGDGEDLDTDGPATDACVEGPGVREIHILPGAGMPDSPAWYDPAEPDLTGIHTICWVNDDNMPHRILAMPMSVETTPGWVLSAINGGATGGDDHGGHGGHGDGAHDHGGGALTVFDVEFGVGERLAMPLDNTYSALSVHCHPHPWMVAEWQFLPEAEQDYPTEIGHIVFAGNASGDTEAGASAESKFTVDAPNLRSIRITVAWDDADDDQQGLGTTLNKSDQIRVELKDPSGEVVASEEATNRKGLIPLQYDLPLEWPTAVKARGMEAAAAKLAADVPDDMSGAGEWTVVVTVLMANGATNVDGDTPATLDGHEDWTLDFEAVHEYAKVLSPGRTHMVLANPTATLPLS